MAALFSAVLAGCGGSSGGGDQAASAPSPNVPGPTPPDPTPTSQRDAVRLADQASFGPTEALLTSIKAKGAPTWVAEQMGLKTSSYTGGAGGEIHQYTAAGEFCDNKGSNCWRDYYSTEPLLWDFYRNAIKQPDQLRQRVAFALQQIVVVNSLDVSGNY
ncbi:MAG: DUF1800 family protein, partial [Rhodoglobus sp.]